LTSLDNLGFDLEKDFNGSDDVIEDRVEKNLVFQMRRVDVKNKRKAKDFIFEQNKSGIVLPQEIFNKVHAVAGYFISSGS
jgi:hypothetical protein